MGPVGRRGSAVEGGCVLGHGSGRLAVLPFPMRVCVSGQAVPWVWASVLPQVGVGKCGKVPGVRLQRHRVTGCRSGYTGGVYGCIRFHTPLLKSVVCRFKSRSK